MSEPGPGARQLAEMFHDRYERLAPSFGYETRVETRAFDPTSKNGRLMIAVCDEILTWLDLRVTADELARLRAALADMVNLATFGEQCSSCGKYIAIDGHREDCSAVAAQRLLSGGAAETDSPLSTHAAVERAISQSKNPDAKWGEMETGTVACAHPVGSYVCPTCGVHVTSENGS